MAKIRNMSTIPSGMLNPNGLSEPIINPDIQATTRPAGTLLAPSPGYDSVRIGKNRFQGKGPTGGFRRQTFAEDVGGTGAALSIVPGETTAEDATEWLPENLDSIPEGSMIIADRALRPGTAMMLHQGQGTIPDMGDRTAARPLSKMWWARLNPSSVLRQEYQQSPAIAVAMGAGFVYVVWLVANEAERAYRGRGRGIGSTVTAIPSGAAQGAGDVTSDAIDKIGDAADKAVNAIEDATDKAVNAIERTTDKVTGD